MECITLVNSTVDLLCGILFLLGGYMIYCGVKGV